MNDERFHLDLHVSITRRYIWFLLINRVPVTYEFIIEFTRCVSNNG